MRIGRLRRDAAFVRRRPRHPHGGSLSHAAADPDWHTLDHQQATDEQLEAWWRQWPIDRWLDVQNGQRWFSLDGELLGLTVDCPEELQGTLESMTEELVDWRLAAYSKAHRLTDNCKPVIVGG